MEYLLNDKNATNFGLYFNRNYRNHVENYPENWDCAFRKLCGINTNMVIDIFKTRLSAKYQVWNT